MTNLHLEPTDEQAVVRRAIRCRTCAGRVFFATTPDRISVAFDVVPVKESPWAICGWTMQAMFMHQIDHDRLVTAEDKEQALRFRVHRCASC